MNAIDKAAASRQKNTEKMRRWRAANPERAAASRRAYQEKNKEKLREYEREYRENNAEKSREKNRRWYARNAETERQRKIAYRNENIDKFRENARAYNAANKPRVATIARNRRAKKRANGGTHTTADIADIFKLQRGRCACCRIKLGDDYHIDHIIPLKAGGSNDRRNLQILCAPCNQSKSARDPITFMQMKGMLL